MYRSRRLRRRNMRHNQSFAPARYVVLLLAVLLAGGCDTPPHRLPQNLLPSFAGITVLPQVYFQGATLPGPVLPAALGGDAPIRYTLDPALPPGLTFDAATRAISGTPTETLASTVFTYTAVDTDSDTASLTFTLSVSTISLDADAPVLAEWNDPGVPVTVSVSEPPPLAVEVTLDAGGTATPGGDVEFDGSPDSDSDDGSGTVRVTIEAGADQASTTLRSIPDFEEEGNKSIELSVVSANGSRFNGSGPSVSLELLDEGAMFPDAKDRLTSAVLVLFNNFRQTGTGLRVPFRGHQFRRRNDAPHDAAHPNRLRGFRAGTAPGQASRIATLQGSGASARSGRSRIHQSAKLDPGPVGPWHLHGHRGD